MDNKITIKSKNEVGQFAVEFNKMVEELKQSKENVEGKVEERTAQLEKVNKFMVGRELKMVDLKKEINKLEKKNDSRKKPKKEKS